MFSMSVYLLVGLCIPTYHVCNNHIHFVMWLYFSQPWMAALNTCIATMSSLAQLWVWDTEKQRQHRCDDARLTKSGNIRNGQLLMMPTELLTNREWLQGKLLSGSECSKAQLFFLDMKYQACSSIWWDLQLEKRNSWCAQQILNAIHNSYIHTK